MKASKWVGGDVAWQWLQRNPAPVRSSEMAAWSVRVCEELTVAALPELMRLLEHGDDEQQYQAVAASRALGAEVWATGDGRTYEVTQPQDAVATGVVASTATSTVPPGAGRHGRRWTGMRVKRNRSSGILKITNRHRAAPPAAPS